MSKHKLLPDRGVSNILEQGEGWKDKECDLRNGRAPSTEIFKKLCSNNVFCAKFSLG